MQQENLIACRHKLYIKHQMNKKRIFVIAVSGAENFYFSFQTDFKK